MNKIFPGLILLLVFGLGATYLITRGDSCFSQPRPGLESREVPCSSADFYERLIPLHRTKTPPGPLDWLANHPEEGQTFAQYIAANLQRPDQKRRIIYLALLGDFDSTQKKIMELTAEFIEAYFGLPVKFITPLPLSLIPAEARRSHPQTEDKQILSTYVLDDILKGRLPGDGFCLMAFTSSDLWPGPGWNFVFGQASLLDRVAVWSIYRNGNPSGSDQDFKVCLLRTIKTGTHEIGHMLGMEHCIFYECNMNGSNHRQESDQRPLWLCPVCLRKLIWATGSDPVKRMEQLAKICQRFNFSTEAEYYQNAFTIIKSSK